jgi:hypothetical protein
MTALDALPLSAAQTVRRFHADLAAGDVDAALSRLVPDALWTEAGGASAGVHRQRDVLITTITTLHQEQPGSRAGQTTRPPPPQDPLRPGTPPTLTLARPAPGQRVPRYEGIPSPTPARTGRLHHPTRRTSTGHPRALHDLATTSGIPTRTTTAS